MKRGILSVGRGKAWTIREIEYVKQYYLNPMYSTQDIADYLGRSRNSVYLKATRLGLTKQYVPEVSDPELIKQLECYGREFGERCVDRCKAWSDCLDSYVEYEKTKLIQFERKIIKARIKGHVSADSLIQAIKDAVRE